MMILLKLFVSDIILILDNILNRLKVSLLIQRNVRNEILTIACNFDWTARAYLVSPSVRLDLLFIGLIIGFVRFAMSCLYL